ncbi:MAG: hypothetical protein V7646_294 [Pseudonocardia sp.]|jgi:hypothetical protein
MGAGTRVLSVLDLSPGLGQAAVLGVSTTAPDGRPSQWIVKIPVGATSPCSTRAIANWTAAEPCR